MCVRHQTLIYYEWIGKKQWINDMKTLQDNLIISDPINCMITFY